MTVLVTGGGGFIGSHVCKELKKQGLLPVVYDNFSQGCRAAVKWGPCVSGDLLGTHKLSITIQQYQPLGVIHLASLINARDSASKPMEYYQVNLAGTLSLAQAMVQNGVSYLVFSSSAAVYGIPDITPIIEEAPKNPIHPYGYSKWMSEQILTDFSKAYPLYTASLRYFNAAGADPDCEIGEAHNPETHLIPNCILAALGKKAEIAIFGTDHPTQDGTAVRDYIHVTDLAIAHVQALAWLQTHKKSAAFNLGSQAGFSVQQIITEIRKHSQASFPIDIQPKSLSDPPILIADASKARNHLQWEPQYSDLATIIDTAWRWHTTQG